MGEEAGNSREAESKRPRNGGKGGPRLMAKAFNPISPEWKFTRAPLSFTSPFQVSLLPSLPASLNTEKGSKEDEQTTSQGFPNPTPAPAL